MTANTGTLTLNGTERPFQVNTPAQLKAFTQAMGIGLSEIGQQLKEMGSNDLLDVLPLISVFAYSAIYAAAIRADKHCDLTLAEVEDWAQNSDVDEVLPEISKPFALFLKLRAEKKS